MGPAVKYVMLDLYCGEGGAAAGYVRTSPGFRVYGVDKEPRVEPFYLEAGGSMFWSGDATDVELWLDIIKPDAVHASPPCKDHTDLASRSDGDGTGWMLGHTIDRLREWGNRTGRPWIVENVNSPTARRVMPDAVILCGTQFGLQVDGRHLRRHRLFTSNVPLLAPGPCSCSGKPIIGVYGTGGGGQMTRGYKATAEQARTVMGMPWASRNGTAQAIPPDYTEYLGSYLIDWLQASPAAGRSSGR